jgi:uncharacterized protein (TIGR02996 family)
MLTDTKKVTTFSRRGSGETPGLSAFAKRIGENPADRFAWLVLADWLRDYGYDHAESVVRSLWQDDSPAVDGEITRGFWQWENGGKHWEGVTVECKGGQWFHCYWSNGNFRAPVSREYAQKVISSAGKPCRRVSREPWTGETKVSEVVTTYDGLTIG